MPADQASYCTVELKTGSFVEVDVTPAQLLKNLMIDTSGLLELPRHLIKPSRTTSGFRDRVWLNSSQIVAIYPLDEVPYKLESASRP